MIVKFTGRIEVFPTQTEKAEEVLKKKKQLLYEIIRSLQSDNGTSFTSKVTQGSLKNWAFLIIFIVPGGLSLQEN